MLIFQETWLGPINDERGRPELKNDSLKPSLFVLREDKTLTRYDLRTGQILESHFLFSTRKFTELRLNAGNPNVLVKSTKLSGFCQETACQHTNCNRICFSFIAFSYPSLKFQAHLEVSETIFKNLYNAVISDGILIIINSKKTAKLYDFNHIMQENMTKSLKIGDKVGTDIVGQYPLGFPINVVIKEEPSVLFQVHCQDYDIGFSSFFPPLCVTTAKDYCYKVRLFLMSAKLLHAFKWVEIIKVLRNLFEYFMRSERKTMQKHTDPHHPHRKVVCFLHRIYSSLPNA